MTATIETSTIRNLTALAGDAHTALAYGRDIADLLSGDDTVRPDEADLLAAAVGVALGVAAREVTDSYGSARQTVARTALAAAARSAAAGLGAIRGDEPTTEFAAILHAITFQLTDVDEQD